MGNVHSQKCLFWEMSFGELSARELFIGETFLGNCLCGKGPLGKFLLGNYLRTEAFMQQVQANLFYMKLIKKLCTKLFPIEEHSYFFMSQFVFLSELFINALVSIFERIQQQLNIDNYTIDIFVDLIKSIWYSGPWCTD